MADGGVVQLQVVEVQVAKEKRGGLLCNPLDTSRQSNWSPPNWSAIPFLCLLHWYK